MSDGGQVVGVRPLPAPGDGLRRGARLRNRAVERMPGTARFRSRRRAALRARAREQVALVGRLTGLPFEEQAPVRDRVRWLAVRMEDVELRKGPVRALVGTLGILLTAVAIVLAVRGLDWVGASSGAVRWIVGLLLGYGLYAAIALPGALHGRPATVLWDSVGAIWAWSAAVVVALATLVAVVPRPAEPGLGADLLFALVAGALGALVAYAGVVATIVAVALCTEPYERVLRHRYAEGLALFHLLAAVRLAEQPPARGKAQETKRQLAQRLEQVARRLERDVPRQHDTGDPETMGAVRRVLEEAAAAFRELKLWAQLPYPDTREHLAGRLYEAVPLVARGEWHRLPRTNPQHLRIGLRQRVTTAILRGGISFLPLTVLLVAQSTRFRLEGELAAYATLLAVLWAVVGLLSAIDPRFSEKLAAVKDVAERVRPL